MIHGKEAVFTASPTKSHAGKAINSNHPLPAQCPRSGANRTGQIDPGVLIRLNVSRYCAAFS